MSDYTLKVKINCDNAAFGEGNLEHEIHRIIREQVLGCIETEDGGADAIYRIKHLFDVNGNRVGTSTACLKIDGDENESEEV